MRKLSVLRLHFLSALLLAACQTGETKNIDRPYDSLTAVKPGTVLQQSSEKLGNGFYDVSKSIVNPSGHWEGVGHFRYIYHNKTEICQCSPYDTVRAPDGTYIVFYSNKRNRLEMFNTRAKEYIILSDEYIGYPQSAEWDLAAGTAIIRLSAPDGGDIQELQISLN